MEDPDAEGSRFLEGLVRNHLRAIRYPEPRPARHPNVDEGNSQLLVEVLAAGLEQDGNAVLGRLLTAAMRVCRNVDGEDAAVIHDFLQRSVDYIMGVGSKEGIVFLQNVLEDLLKSRERAEDGAEDDDVSDSEANETMLRFDSPSDASIIVVSIGDDTMQVDFDAILSCFWTAQLDGACHACGQIFVDEPPIRTIAKEAGDENQPPPGSAIHVRVFNRHFSCIQEGSIHFVPVSHVWDDSIRDANMDRRHNDAAALKLLTTLEALFEGAEDAYNRGVEFWHDYFSVPQWQDDLKESLLLRLPAIYHHADEILVHVHDLPSEYVALLLLGQQDGSLLQTIENIPRLRALCNSEWMQRLWVCIEYALCRAACVMDADQHIRRFRDYDPGAQHPIVAIFARDTFTRLIAGAHAQMLGAFRHARHFATGLTLPGDFLGGMAARGDAEAAAQRPQLCLGKAVELVLRRKCQLPRDRLLAVHILLGDPPPPWLSDSDSRVPPGEDESCAWVWSKALAKDDYSAMLLQPREIVEGSDATPDPAYPSWLVGHWGLEWAEWNCGDQVAPPTGALRVMMNGRHLHADLDQVGRIEAVHYLGVEDSGETAGVEWAIALLRNIARRAGEVLSAEGLVDGLNRIFPYDVIHTRLAARASNMVFSFEEIEARNPGFGDLIAEFLERYPDAAYGEQGNGERSEVARDISEALQLGEHIGEAMSGEITRLTRSRHIARKRRDRGAAGGEPICEVKCPECCTVAPFRLDLRATGKLGDMVYRIPGLSYSEAVEDGVGLVLGYDSHRITGRMLYGPPACACRLRVSVEIA